MTIPAASFAGSTVARSATIRLFGAVQPPAAVGPPRLPGAGGGMFACSVTSGLAFSWGGDNSLGETISLGFQNQARKRLANLERKLLLSCLSRFRL